jgi:PhoH-like ATPase
MVLLRNGNRAVWGISPKNKEQRFAIDLLMNDSIQLVTLVGVAGTGKTLLAIAAGLEKTLEEGKYKKVLITRPVIPVGRDLGYLPGDLQEKLDPWMQPIHDNVAFLTAGHTSSKIEGQKSYGSYETKQYLQDMGLLSIESLTHIRGRSIPHQFIIIDEAQNLTPHEAKTLLTRAGEGTKIVLTGDPYQIDHPYLDSSSNGLTYIVDRFKGEPVAGTVMLRKGERSGLAEMAARLL